jgi:flagellar P-ring protein precursor FlgI
LVTTFFHSYKPLLMLKVFSLPLHHGDSLYRPKVGGGVSLRLTSTLGLFILSVCPLITTPVYADRIKDMGAFQGLRSNQLTGYGIVVGLAGTGDDSLDYATLGLKGAISRFGLSLPQGTTPALKNTAAVIITAELPPFAKPGQRLDITVSAIGKAKSLRGGTLLLAPLMGADGQIYAMSQGNLVVGGLGVEAADGSKVSINVPSVGRIDGGASVERSVETGLEQGNSISFNLAIQDLTNAQRVASAINKSFNQSIARADDGATVTIAAPDGKAARVMLMSKIENLEVSPADPPARVIINARTGTVVINGAVRISPVAISHGKLTVRVEEKPRVIQPNPLSQGQTATQQSSKVTIEDTKVPAFVMPRGASLSEIVKAINQIGTSPGDLAAILEALKQAGALNAELVVI